MSCQDVFGLFLVADDLLITLYIHRGRLHCTVEDGECRTSLVLTGDDIDAVIGNKLRLSAFDDDLVALSPMQESACPLEHLLFSVGTSVLRKGVMGVIGESTREVLTDITVRHFFRTVHQNLRTIIDLGYAVDGQQEGECLLEHERVAAVT